VGTAGRRRMSEARGLGALRVLGALVPVWLALLWPLTSAPLRAQSDSLRIERLAGLGRVWGEVKYFHPALASAGAIDWDSALAAAVPQVNAARDRGEYRAALGRLLAALSDPLTRIEESGTAEAAPVSGGDGLSVRWTTDSILIVATPDYYNLYSGPSQGALARVFESLDRARALVLDVRTARPTDPYGAAALTSTVAPIERAFLGSDLSRPGTRRRVYYGYDNLLGRGSGQYRSGTLTEGQALLRRDPRSRARPVVVVLNRYAVLPAAAAALQLAGQAQLVYAGDPGLATLAESRTIPVGDGLIARVRVSEPVAADGSSARPRLDLVVPEEAADAAVDSALARLRPFRPQPVNRVRLRATADLRPESSYPAMASPALPYRMLAAFRFWNTIRLFYPYTELLDQPWDATLPVLIRQFEAAEDSVAYALAVVGAARLLHDGHAYVAGGAYGALVGEGYPPIRVRWIERTPVVTALYDAELAARAGVQVGDVVLRVDGEAASDRLERYEGYFSASTAAGLRDKATLAFLNGPVGSSVRLTLRSATGRIREARLERRREDFTTLYHRERSGPVLRFLPGNIGYADLDRLSYDMVDSMFDRFRHTRGIVFDMRGYPNGTLWAIASRLTRGTPVAAVLMTPLPGHPAPAEATARFAQRIDPPAPGTRRYPGRTVLLIDERSQSQAEHTGLYFKAANGTLLVGSATAGADGEIASLSLPGGMTVGFTGQAVTWPDGRQLQRTGLRPDVPVRPTLRGIRAGRDEVLDAAVRALSPR